MIIIFCKVVLHKQSQGVIFGTYIPRSSEMVVRMDEEEFVDVQEV